MRFFLILFIVCIGQLHALKIAIVSVAVGEKYQKAVMPGFINKQAYCEEHGYDFYYVTESLDPSRYPAWSKILIIQQILADYDWVFWTDADSLIMNPSIAVEQLVDDRYFLVICKQIDGTINSGQFLIKNTPLSFQFLDRIYAPDMLHKGWIEQGAVIEILNTPPYAQNVLILHQRAFNSICPKRWANVLHDAHYHDGDFILHFAMSPNVDTLATYMEDWFRYLRLHEAKIRSTKPTQLRRRP